MNYPRIIFYTRPISGPSDLKLETNQNGKTKGIYLPPKEEMEIIRHLEEDGYGIMVNANGYVAIECLDQLSGIVFVEGRLYTIKEYSELCYGRIKCLIYYQQPLGEAELLISKRHFSKYFGIHTQRNILTRRFRKLIDKGILAPIPKIQANNEDCLQHIFH